MFFKLSMNDETPEGSTVTLAVALLVRLGTFFFLINWSELYKGFVKYHHFSLSNITCKREELIIILAAFSYFKG